MFMGYDLALNGGTVFDGSGAPRRVASVAIRDGVVAAIGEGPFEAERVVDARGLWLMPGFLDVHTHYDAEVEAAPALSESLVHGVTTIFMGSCSLGAVLSEPLDLADMYTRVEAMPREHVLPLFEKGKTWRTPREYRDHLSRLRLGPNVSAFMGHSDLRCAAMGLERSVTDGVVPTAEELAKMKQWLADGLDAGFLGLSCNTNRWDKLGGTRFRSKPLPSTYARWSEIRELVKVVRERGRVLQGIPNISAKYDTFLFFFESMGLWFREAVKTSLVSMVDVRSNRLIYKALGFFTRAVNALFGGDVKFQALPMQFDLFVDGLDAPVFEELGAGTAALHLEEAAERRALLLTPSYRSWFRSQWTSRFAPKVFHRDFKQSQVVSCPDASLVGRSFHDIAASRGADVVEVFLDLCAEHGDALRWRTVIGNDRPHAVKAILAHPDTAPGFSDAGAHLRNMAFYNFPLVMLRLAARDGFMPVEQAVHQLTGGIADWYGLDAGHLAVGSRADLAVIDPARLDESLDGIHEGTMPEFGGWMRLVRRNPEAVPYVLVNGRVAAERGELRDVGHGRFLGVGDVRSPASVEPALAAA